jgi:plastocyanin
MQKFSTLGVILLLLLIFQSCYKEEVYEENPYLLKKRVLVYDTLKPLNPSIFTGDTATIEATASGDSLRFEWTAEDGELLPHGNTAKFTSSTPGNYAISCKIFDKYGNVASKQVSLLVATEMVFSELTITEPLIPINYTTKIAAKASGEGIEYSWSVPSGQITAIGDSAFFTANSTGTHSIKCTATDKYGMSIEKLINVEVTDLFVYKAITASPVEINAGDYSEVTANVLGGDDCTYAWKTYPPANIVGSGHKVLFTICHADVFQVSCMVTDRNGNSMTQSVSIKVN